MITNFAGLSVIFKPHVWQQCKALSFTEKNGCQVTFWVVVDDRTTTNQSILAPGGGGGDSHMKQTGMLVVSLRGVNFGFWSLLGCSGQSANILSRQGLFNYVFISLKLIACRICGLF